MAPSCSFCSKYPVLVDLQIYQTIFYCEDHRPAQAELISDDPEIRKSYVKDTCEQRTNQKLCFECGKPTLHHVVWLGLQRYYCNDHQQEAQRFLRGLP